MNDAQRRQLRRSGLLVAAGAAIVWLGTKGQGAKAVRGVARMINTPVHGLGGLPGKGDEPF
jgi:hypothetical protein